MSKVDLNRMGVFKAVAEAGSFSRAAASLRQPKSRISRQIAALEAELGVRLIQRTTRQFQLSPAGRELYQRSMGPLKDLTAALQELSQFSEQVGGRVRVTVPEDMG